MQLCDGVLETLSHCSLMLPKFSCCYLEAFLSFDFFKLDIPEKLWMSSFNRFHELSFRREKYDLQYGLKFISIKWSDQKSTFRPSIVRVFGLIRANNGKIGLGFLVRHLLRVNWSIIICSQLTDTTNRNLLTRPRASSETTDSFLGFSSKHKHIRLCFFKLLWQQLNDHQVLEWISSW